MNTKMGPPTHIKWRESQIPVVNADRRWKVSMSRIVAVGRSKKGTRYAEAHGRLFFDPKGKAYELTKDSSKSKPSLYLYVQQLNDYTPITEVVMDDMIRDTYKRILAREVANGSAKE